MNNQSSQTNAGNQGGQLNDPFAVGNVTGGTSQPQSDQTAQTGQQAGQGTPVPTPVATPVQSVSTPVVNTTSIPVPQAPVPVVSPTSASPVTQDAGGFASFKKEEDKKKPFDPASPVTGTLGATEEEILGGSKNIFGRPISYAGDKPKDAKGQFEFILNIKLPEHKLDFDNQKFKELLAGSISLLFEEKMEIVNTLSKITQDQINKLIEILEDEQKKFKELTEKHKEEMTKKKQEEMEVKMQDEKKFLEKEVGSKDDDLQQAEDLLKGLGM